MIDPANVPQVREDELLARYVMHSSHVRRDRTVKPDAFMPHRGELSVTRHLLTTEAELWAVGQGIAAATSRTLHGRANISAAACIIQKLVVRAAPVHDNPNHANVTGWPVEKPAQKTIAQQIAATASFAAAP